LSGAGTYQWVAAYSGDSNNNPVSSSKGNEPETVVAPDVDVTKTADAATITAGQTAGFTVKVYNEGAGTAYGVTLNDPLPAGDGNDINWKIDPNVDNPSAFQITGPVGAQVLQLNPTSITLAANASLSVHITGVTSTADGTPSGAANISSNFNGTAIAYNPVSGQNNYIWFNSIISPKGLPKTGTVSMQFTNQQISFSYVDPVSHATVNENLGVPNATLTLSSSTTTASTYFNTTSNSWVTNLPLTGLAGNDFLSGLAFKVPVDGLPGGIQPVAWSGTFSTATKGLSVQWKWAAVVYNNFSSNYNALDVKPSDDSNVTVVAVSPESFTSYHNSDHAGTPEAFTIPGILPGGATGGGGSNWTGSYSGTQAVNPFITGGVLNNTATVNASNETSAEQNDQASATVTVFLPTNNAVTLGNQSAFGPADIRTAYGINNLAGDGTGQTIAIVEAYGDPAIYQSVDSFDSQFGLTASGPNLYSQYGSASSFLSVMNQNGQATSLPGFDPTGGWETEAALDVEWAHAVAPGVQIILVEANSQSLADLMSAVATAASQPGVSVVSMSWGFAEGQAVFQRDEALYDSFLTTPAGHQPVTFVASTGDYGTADPEYPSFSPNVLAVGGTSLSLNTDGSYNSETGWGYYSSAAGTFVGSGGGTSLYEPQPAYQLGVQTTGMRSTPDVSFLADPATGAWIADSYSLPAANPWEVAGGTSLSAPSWAGLIAVVNQGRLANGEALLSSSGGVEAQAALYSLPQSDFNAITSGTNGGYTAAVGYNMVAGLGTPVANFVVAGLIGYQSFSPANLTAADQPTINATTASYGTSAAGTANVFNVFNVQTGESLDMGGALRSNGAMVGLRASAFQRRGDVGSPGAGILNGTAAGMTEPAMELHTAGIDAVMAELIHPTIQGADHMAQCGDWSSGGGFVAEAPYDSSVTSIGGAFDRLLDDAEADWLLLDKITKH
jgi:uncharacterized repeat protein (TIGR01451 family)